MRRIFGTIVVIAALGMFSAALLNVAPGTVAVAAAIAPSPTVSVTTLPQLPTVPPAEPTYVPSSLPQAIKPPIVAAPGTVIQIVGEVASPKVLNLKDLQLMRKSSLTLHVLDPDGRRRVHIYTGVLLRDLIASASPTGPGGATTSTRAYAFVQGVNGYSATIAFPEFETAFNNKQILVAYMVDLASLPGRNIGELVVPEDQSPGRFVMGIATIRIGSPAP